MISELTNKPVYTIGVAAQILRTSPQTLRLYEKEGLILSHRTATNRRMYSDVELAKVRCIQRMIREEGMNFAGLRHLFAFTPCWKLRPHKEVDHEKCPAFHNTIQPCWASTEKCLQPENSCRDCPVYLNSIDCAQLKKMLYELAKTGQR